MCWFFLKSVLNLYFWIKDVDSCMNITEIVTCMLVYNYYIHPLFICYLFDVHLGSRALESPEMFSFNFVKNSWHIPKSGRRAFNWRYVLSHIRLIYKWRWQHVTYKDHTFFCCHPESFIITGTRDIFAPSLQPS